MPKETPPTVPPVPGLAPRMMPFPRPDVAVLEAFVHPLYSAHAFDAAVIPVENLFFSYGVGGTVAGAGAGAITATEAHTNLRTPARLSTPKVALVTGFSLVATQLTAPLTALLQAPTSTSETAVALNVVEDLQRILFGTVFQFRVGGTKDYYTAPAWNVPGNIGIDGIVAQTVNAQATQGPFSLLNVAPNGMGQFQELEQSPIFLPSEQEFQALLIARQATPPTLAAARVVWAVLPAIQGREVM